jgi:hypothetical protein
LNGRQFPSPEGNEASESRSFHRNVRPAPVHQPPPEKCDVNARVNEPKPPRVTPPEAESDEVPDAERHANSRFNPQNKNPAIYGGVQSGGESLTGSL